MTFVCLLGAALAADPLDCAAERAALKEANRVYDATPVQCADGTASSLCTCALDDLEGCCAGHNGLWGEGCYAPPETTHPECSGFEPTARTAFDVHDVLAAQAAPPAAPDTDAAMRAAMLTRNCYRALGWDWMHRQAEGKWAADVAAGAAALAAGATEEGVLQAVRAAPKGATLSDILVVAPVR